MLREGDYTIINPKQAKESQKAIFTETKLGEKVQEELNTLLGIP